MSTTKSKSKNLCNTIGITDQQYDQMIKLCDKFMMINDQLKREGLPIPLTSCQCCGKTMFMLGEQRQCPECGASTTAFGGCFPFLTPDGSKYNRNNEWAKLCDKATARIKHLKEYPEEIETP